MSIRDREVLETLRDDPELLALADAVVETQSLRRVRPFGAVAAVALVAAALFVLVLASPWDRGGESGSVLDRALAAIDTSGPVTHMTIRFQTSDGDAFSPVVNEAFYDKQRGLVRVVSRNAGDTVADYTTRASEDEFAMFPGLLEGAEYYRRALSSGNARIVGEGTWRGRAVHWLRLQRLGGPGLLEVGIARDDYRPVVFRTLNASGAPSGFEVAVLDYDYVSSTQAGFEPDAPVVARGKVLGPDCRPARARVGVVLAPSPTGPLNQVSVEVTSARSGPDGSFTLRLDPAKGPFHREGRFDFTLNAQIQDPTQGFAFVPFSRTAKDGRWVPARPLTVTVSKDPAPRCD